MAQPPILKSSQPHSVSLSEGSSVATRKPVRKPADKEPAATPARRSNRSAGTPREDALPIPAIIARDTGLAPPLNDWPQEVAPPPPSPLLNDALARRLEELKHRNDIVRATLARQTAATRGKTP